MRVMRWGCKGPSSSAFICHARTDRYVPRNNQPLGDNLKMIRTVAFTATLFATASIAATAQARPMTPEDVAKIESVGAIAVSPDGSRVAYTTASLPDITDGEENGTTTQQLNLAYAPGNTREFLPDDMSISGIAFSPDGRMMSFLWTDGDEDRAVYGIPVTVETTGSGRKVCLPSLDRQSAPTMTSEAFTIA